MGAVHLPGAYHAPLDSYEKKQDNLLEAVMICEGQANVLRIPLAVLWRSHTWAEQTHKNTTVCKRC